MKQKIMEHNTHHRSDQSVNTLDILSSRSSPAMKQQFQSTERSNTLWNFSHQSEIEDSAKNKQHIQSKHIKKTIIYYSSEQRYRVYQKIQNYTSLINHINIKHLTSLKKEVLIKVRQIVQKQTTESTGYIQLIYQSISLYNVSDKLKQSHLNRAQIIKGQTQLVNLIKDISLQKIIVKFLKQNCYFTANQAQQNLNIKYYLPIQAYKKIQDQQLIIRNAINFTLEASYYIQTIIQSKINDDNNIKNRLIQLLRHQKLLAIPKEEFYQQQNFKNQRDRSQKYHIIEKLSCSDLLQKPEKQMIEDSHSTKPSTDKAFKTFTNERQSNLFENYPRQSYLSRDNRSQRNIFKKYDSNKVLRISSTQKKLYSNTQSIIESVQEEKGDGKKNFRIQKTKGINIDTINKFRLSCTDLRQTLSIRKY